MEVRARPSRLPSTALFVAAVLVGGGASAYPTSLNIVPVADTMGARAIRVEVESDGARTPFEGGVEVGLYTQYGVSDRLEVGLDVTDITRGPGVQLNAKWQLLRELGGAPAVALGVLHTVGSGGMSGGYIVLSKDQGDVRLHAGVLADGATRGMLAAEYWASERLGILADWTSGPDACLTLGVYRDTGAGGGGLLDHGWGNGGAGGDFVGLSLCWEGR